MHASSAKKRISSSGGTKQKKRKTDDENGMFPNEFKEKSLFIKMVKKCGLFLMDGSASNVLKCDQTIFLRDFLKAIKSHDDYPEVVEDIFEGFEKYVGEEQRFIRSMFTTDQLEDEDSDAPQRAVQDSMIRLMLKTQPLQSAVALLIIKKLEDYKENSNIKFSADSYGSQHNTIDIPQLIMNQLRWLDTIDDAHSVAENLVKMAHVMSYQSACGIITSLPEIISDEIHNDVALKLKELLSLNAELTIAILDTMCNLNCSDQTIEDVKESVFTCLETVKHDELPVVVKYLLQTMTSANAESNLAHLRNNLNFSTACLTGSSQSPSTKNQEKTKTSVRLTAETILSAIQYQPCVADSWIKLFKKLDDEELKSSDFVILILLCSNFNTAQKKSAFSVMKHKLMSTVMSESFLRLAFEQCSYVLIPYFSTIADLAARFVSSRMNTLQDIGGVLYACMFSNLDDYCRQEVIGCLVQHVGSPYTSEVDTALNVMKGLSVNFLILLSPFTLFVKGILDHVDRLSCYQIRLVYEVLSHLAFNLCDGKTPAIQNELHMLIRKQLTHTSPKYRYIGVIGAVRILGVLGSKENCDGERYKTALSVLKLLEETTVTSKKIRAYYLDEIIPVFRSNLDSRLHTNLYEIFCKEFDEIFFSAGGCSSTTDEMSACVMFNMMEDDSPEVKIPIFPAVLASDFRHNLLCPLLRSIMETSSKDSSKLLDIILSPIILHTADTLDNFKVLGMTEQKMVMDSLFIAVNWFRENICAFVREKSWHTYALTRIDHILKIGNILEVLFPALQSYNPPSNNLDFGSSAMSSKRKEAAAANVTQEDKSPISLRSSMRENDVNGNQHSDMKKSKNTNRGSKKKTEPVFNIHEIKPSNLRELDIDVFSLLKLSMGEDIFNTDVNTDTDSPPCMQLFPSQLMFLLQDLQKKVRHKLPTSDCDKKVSPFGAAPTHVGYEKLESLSQSEFGHYVGSLIPYLCNHLEAICAPFQSSCIEDLELKKQHCLTGCYEHLLNLLLSILSWKGLREDEPHLRTVLLSIARRITADLNMDSSVKEMLKNSFSYLKNFEATAVKAGLASAASLAKLLSTLASLEKKHEISFASELRDLTQTMLKQDWSQTSLDSSSTGQKRNEMLGILLRLRFKYAEDVLKTVSYFLDAALCKLGKNDSNESEYPCFHKSNSHVLFVCLIEALADESNKITGSKTNDDETARISLLLRWNEFMQILGLLLRLLRDFHHKSNTVASLKCGRIMIDNFIKNGMPVCDKMFQHYQDDVVGLLRHLQMSTRQLQHLTCHSKVTKDVSLAKHVPPLKRCLETLLFRVKGMLVLHSCQEAFWLGNLKNRTIHGQEILSQAVETGDSGDENESVAHADVDMSYSESY